MRDEEGRRRFHGAFTGGFSAGYYNTVGSKEGMLLFSLNHYFIFPNDLFFNVLHPGNKIQVKKQQKFFNAPMLVFMPSFSNLSFNFLN